MLTATLFVIAPTQKTVNIANPKLVTLEKSARKVGQMAGIYKLGWQTVSYIDIKLSLTEKVEVPPVSTNG